jgi:hypothetical protein
VARFKTGVEVRQTAARPKTTVTHHAVPPMQRGALAPKQARPELAGQRRDLD